jgi:hypothetical protein
LRCLDPAGLSRAVWGVRMGAHERKHRRGYEPTTEVPPRLLALIRQLSGVEHGLLPKEFPTALLTLVQKLDALEGDQLLRQCGERLRDLPKKPLPD